MKKITIILVISSGISLSLFAQLAGDYRSIGNGNWNDPAVWETYDGSSWVNTSTYPGQNSGTGAVMIELGTEIKITTTVPNPIGFLRAVGLWEWVGDETENGHWNYYYGSIVFSAESAISLNVLGGVEVEGVLGIDNLNGAKSHTLSIGESLGVFDGSCSFRNEDDEIDVIFATTFPNSIIYGAGFKDVTFNGIGITASTQTQIGISGTATFINGRVRGALYFADGSTAVGASNSSFVSGGVFKQGDDPFTFPIGGLAYSPLTISAPFGPQEIVGAQYTGPSTFPITDPGLYNISNCEGWWLGYNNISSHPLDVTVGWTSASGCGSSPYITDVSEVTLAHFGETLTWDQHGGVVAGATTNGTVTWSGVTNSGYYTLGNLNACKTPFGLTATNITPISATLNWDAVQDAVSYDVDYYSTVYEAWKNVATGITSTSVNFSNIYITSSTEYKWKVRANCSSGGPSCRQSQFTTLSCGMPTGLSTTNISAASATLNWAPVSFANLYNVEYKQSASSSWTVATGISSLSYNLSGLLASTSYDWRVSAICGGGGSGNYAQSSFTTLSCDKQYEPNNTSGEAKSIQLGTLISDGISSTTDVDWFKVTMLNANNTLQVTLGNLPADYDLYVYNKNLKLVGSSANMGTSNEAATYYSRLRNATYYIKVIGKNGAYNASQCYNLLAQLVDNGGFVTHLSSENSSEMTDASYGLWLYPNPASNFVYLRFNSVTSGPSETQIINAVGQLVKKYPLNMSKGYNQVQIPLHDVKPGMYLLKINKGEFTLIRKFVVAR